MAKVDLVVGDADMGKIVDRLYGFAHEFGLLSEDIRAAIFHSGP